MSHILDNVRIIQSLSYGYLDDLEKYKAAKEGGAEKWELDAMEPAIDDTHEAYDRAIRSLSLDNPAQMVLFIKAVKALGAVEALGRVRVAGEFSSWVNQGLEGWANRITMELHDDE